MEVFCDSNNFLPPTGIWCQMLESSCLEKARAVRPHDDRPQRGARIAFKFWRRCSPRALSLTYTSLEIRSPIRQSNVTDLGLTLTGSDHMQSHRRPETPTPMNSSLDRCLKSVNYPINVGTMSVSAKESVSIKTHPITSVKPA